MKSRFLTVSFLLSEGGNHARVPVSFLRLKGKWMGEAGFAPGDSVQVEVEYGRLVISKLTPKGKVAEPWGNPEEFSFVRETRFNNTTQQQKEK